MATQQQSFAPSYFLLWSRGARAELERLDMEKKRLVYDTYFTLGITWESANPFYVYVEPMKRRERYSGRMPDPSVCHWSPSLSLLLQLRQASRKLSFCSSIYTLRQCCEKRRRSGGTWSTRARERERKEASTRPYVHKTQTLHPITKSTGSDEITCPPSLYSSTHTGQDMRSLG